MTSSSQRPADGPVDPADAPDLAGFRVPYDRGGLDEADLAATPLAQFRAWFADAVAAALPEPNAMVLATAAADGQPSGRTVLLKDADARGFVLYTNLGSRKSRELGENPRASLVFPWFGMQRQVVVVGQVEPVGRDEAAAYFASRPYGSQVGAWASRQSTVLDGRAGLEADYARVSALYPDAVPLPDFWGGWLVRPQTVEFWQGRLSRLHDRLRYRAARAGAPLDDPAAWSVERLSP